MSAIKTNNELNPIRLQALRTVSKTEWKVNEFDGTTKTNEDGKPLHRGDMLQVLRVKNGEVAGVVFGQVSVNIVTPVDVEAMRLYEPVGVYVWNDYDARKTSITIETLAPVK